MMRPGRPDAAGQAPPATVEMAGECADRTAHHPEALRQNMQRCGRRGTMHASQLAGFISLIHVLEDSRDEK